MSIDEFLDQYTPAEMEKLERRDPLKKFSEKVSVQKTLVGKEVREGSPIRQQESVKQSVKNSYQSNPAPTAVKRSNSKPRE